MMPSSQGYRTIPSEEDMEVDANRGTQPPPYSDIAGHRPDVEANDDNGMNKRPVSECPIEQKMSFLRKVYAILSVQLLATAVMSVVAMFHKPYQAWMMSNTWTIWLAFAASLGFMLGAWMNGRNWPWNMVFLSGFTLSMGYTTSFATAASETSAVVMALFMTLTVFFGLTLFTIQSKIDFSSWIPYLSGGLLLLLVCSLIGIFFPYSSTRELLFGIAGTIIFSGYIMVDTYLIMDRMSLGDEVQAALTLYLDVLNLFMSILRILNSQSARD